MDFETRKYDTYNVVPPHDCQDHEVNSKLCERNVYIHVYICVYMYVCIVHVSWCCVCVCVCVLCVLCVSACVS